MPSDSKDRLTEALESIFALDEILVQKVLNKIDEYTSPEEFLQIVNEIVEYFKSQEFLGEYYAQLKNLGKFEMIFLDPTHQEQIRKFPPCIRAQAITIILFAQPKFKKIWNIVNAFKIQSGIELFEKEMNSTKFNTVSNLDEFMKISIEKLTSSLMKIQAFQINLDKNSDSTFVTGSDLSNLGLIILARESGVLVFNDEALRKVFLTKGIETFSTEFKKVIKHAINHSEDIKTFVEDQLKKGGLLSKLMRMDLSSFLEKFSQHTGVKTYDETVDLVDSYTFEQGLCPAALPMHGSKDKISIVEVITYIIIANIPAGLIDRE